MKRVWLLWGLLAVLWMSPSCTRPWTSKKRPSLPTSSRMATLSAPPLARSTAAKVRNASVPVPKKGLTQVVGLVCFDCHNPLTLDRSERGLIFSHQRHLDRGAHCPVCHRAPDHGQEEVRPGGAHSTLSATACLACHEGQKHPAHCTLCHRNRAQIEPQSHEAPNWLRAHGPAGRQPQGCYDCHAEEDCRNCHEVQVPHPSGFLARHGAEAKAHERACNLCHLSRECQACHGVSLPHPPGFDRHHRDAAEQRQVCRKCHAQRMCQDCHRRSNPHPANWRRLHGGKKESRTGSCETCHTRQYCRNCHGLEMPHPRDWLLVGHRVGSSFKAGSVCFRCHEKDYCAKCHVEEVPKVN